MTINSILVRTYVYHLSHFSQSYDFSQQGCRIVINIQRLADQDEDLESISTYLETVELTTNIQFHMTEMTSFNVDKNLTEASNGDLNLHADG
jgi:hypothetical protein